MWTIVLYGAAVMGVRVAGDTFVRERSAGRSRQCLPALTDEGKAGGLQQYESGLRQDLPTVLRLRPDGNKSIQFVYPIPLAVATAHSSEHERPIQVS